MRAMQRIAEMLAALALAAVAAIVDKWSAVVARILRMPDIVEKIIAQGLEPLSLPAEEFRQLMLMTSQTAARIIKTADVQID